MSAPRKYQLEVCTATLEDCIVAEKGGADRIELNTALALGGLTPSLGLLQAARAALRIPIIIMIRPRPAGFCYSANEFVVMQRDVELALTRGASGIAFGVLQADGSIDRARCAQIVRMAEGAELVFHRAFDVTPDPFVALEELMDLGVTRVLTSGQEASALAGAEMIARLINMAAGRIEILPAGGINQRTLAALLARTGCAQVHASLTTTQRDTSTHARPHIRFSSGAASEEAYTGTHLEAVQTLRRMLDDAATHAPA